MWDMFHLIRFISEAKGLFMRPPGHMAHNRAHRPHSCARVRNEIELLGVLPRTGPQRLVTGLEALEGLVCLSRFMPI